MTPIIGITSGRITTSSPLPITQISEAYMRAVTAAGGLPLIIPASLPAEQAPALLARIDGLLLTGGGDLDPALFNGQPHPRIYDIDAGRDRLEIELVKLAAERGRPFLGICRGIQVINVALGGSLLTDIADQTPQAQRHDWFPDIPRDYLAHTVKLQEGCRLAQVLGSTQVQTNSLHHQALNAPAAGLQVTGKAPDGIIEAVELGGHPFGVGVQWHPEWLQHLPAMRALFAALVEAAAQK